MGHAHKLNSNAKCWAHEKKYDETLLQFDLTFDNCDDNEQPLCLIYNKVLAMESIRPYKLKRRLVWKLPH